MKKSPVSIKSLLENVGLKWPGEASAHVTDLQYDSRLVKEGTLFFAVKGVQSDGHDFIKNLKGAVGAIVERRMDSPLPQIVVPSTAAAMSKIANEFYERPSSRLPVIGVTGTNGKTTTTYIIEKILNGLGKSCGVMGTVNYRFKNKEVPAPNTTPMSIDVHSFMWDLIQKKASAMAMEVSSHALEQHRVDQVRFVVGVFTNLTQDHLDYHKDMESYFKAKAKLFSLGPDVKGVVNVDDPYGARLAGQLKNPLTFGIKADAKLKASNVVCNLNGIEFDLKFPSGKSHKVKNNLMGLHNVENCLSAAGALFAFGISEDDVVAGLNQSHAVPGRLERVDAGQKFVVVVDYAHTHDALAQVLSTLKKTGPKKMYCVFGAGGDRDKTKRPKMGRVAAELADKIFITSDNPRTEDPKGILRDVEAGAKEVGKSNYVVIEDREEAIFAAVKESQPGDILLIAGKGHEMYQIIGREKIHFSDQEVARKAIKS